MGRGEAEKKTERISREENSKSDFKIKLGDL